MTALQPVIILTGLSGSGKTIALKSLEDFGCEVIDNLPISLCRPLIEQKKSDQPIAFGIDIRTRGFEVGSFLSHLALLKKMPGIQLTLLFLEADAQVIQRRYRETRRLHPLGLGNTLEICVQRESELLGPIKAHADLVINTTHFSPPEMRRYLHQALAIVPQPFILSVISFAFRYNVPYHADFVFDMRFLKNPYYNQDLKVLTGQSIAIQEYLQKDQDFSTFMDMLRSLLLDLILPRFQQEGRRTAILAFGCTGGRHRSVGTAELTAALLKKNGYAAEVYHRDLL